MRRTTITILAVTLSTVACGGAAETVGQQPAKQTLAGDPSNTTAAGSDKPASAPDESNPPATDPKPAETQDPKPAPSCDLNALNSELSNLMLDEALQQHEHFRCLCDDQGYPLVGNINSKGTRASEFCPTLKEKGLL